EVDVVGAVFLDEHPHRAADRDRVHAVELHAAHLFTFVGGNDPHRLLVAFHQCPGGDHLGDVQPGRGRTIHDLGGPLHRQSRYTRLTAEPPERRIRHACHGGEHHGGTDGDRSDLQSTHPPIVAAFCGPRRCGCGRHAPGSATTTTPSRYGTSGPSPAAVFCPAAAESCAT